MRVCQNHSVTMTIPTTEPKNRRPVDRAGSQRTERAKLPLTRLNFRLGRNVALQYD
jgi:hypothetical protein